MFVMRVRIKPELDSPKNDNRTDVDVMYESAPRGRKTSANEDHLRKTAKEGETGSAIGCLSGIAGRGS